MIARYLWYSTCDKPRRVSQPIRSIDLGAVDVSAVCFDNNLSWGILTLISNSTLEITLIRQVLDAKDLLRRTVQIRNRTGDSIATFEGALKISPPSLLFLKKSRYGGDK